MIENKSQKLLLTAVMGGLGLAAISPQEAQAAFKIQSTSQYSTVVNEEKFKNLADWQARNEERFAALYDSLREYAAGRYTANDVANNLNPTDVMREGDTLEVYSTRGSVIGSTVATEPIVRIGGGSNVPVRDGASGKELAADPSRSVTLAGKNFNFAGADFTGMVSMGDLRSTTPVVRKLSGIAAATLSDTSVEAVNGSQLHATNKALNDVYTTVNKGLNFSNGTTVVNKKLGDTVLIKGDRNITVKNGATTGLEVTLNPNVTGDSFTAGPVSINKNTGINAGSKKITNVQDGAVNATSKDGVNGSQLHASNVKIDANTAAIAKGVVVQDGANTKITKPLGQPITFKNKDANSEVKVTNGEMVIGVSRDLTLNSANVGGKVAISSTGINAGNTKIINVTDGTVSPTSKEAVNGSQLNATNNRVGVVETKLNQGITFQDGQGGSVVKRLGESLKHKNTDGNVKIAVTGGEYVHNLNPDLRVTSVTTGPVSMSGTGINAGSKKITNVLEGAVNPTSKDAVNGSQLNTVKVTADTTKAKVDLGRGFTDGHNKTVTKQLGENLVVKQGNTNIDVKFNAGNELLISTAPNLTADSFTAGNVSMHKDNGINAGSKKINNVADGAVNATSKEAVNGSQLFKAINGISIPAVGNVVRYDGDTQDTVTLAGTNGGTKITNLKAGNISATSTDAINGSQLHTTNTNVGKNAADIAKGVVVQDGANTKITKPLGQAITFKNKDANSEVKVTNGEMVIGVSRDLTLNSANVGGKVAISSTGINAGNTKIINVTDGAVNATSKEAVNGSQLHTTNTNVAGNTAAINKGLNFVDAAGNKANVALGGDMKLVGGNANINVAIDPATDKATIGLNPDVTLNSANVGGKVVINNTGIRAGNTKITEVSDGAVTATSKDAINGSQLFKAINGISIPAVGNVVRYDGDTQDTVTLAGNNGGTKITNLKAGNISATSTDAINGAQLHDAINKGFSLEDEGGAKITKPLGGSIVLKAKDANSTVTVNNGKMEFGVSRDLTLNSANVGGKVVINGNGINAGNTKIINVADGAVNATSKEAVNGSQLHTTNTNVAGNTAAINKGLNFVDAAGNKANVALGGDMKLVGGNANINVAIDPATDKATIGLNPDVTLNSANIGGKVVINNAGANFGNTKLLNVADGAVNATSKEAINGSQLHNALNNLNIPTLPDNIVQYNDNTKTTVSFKGQGGTTLTNVKAGAVNATSTDAINGSQLHTTNTNVAKNAADIAKGYGVKTQDGKTVTKALGSHVEIVGGKNINTTVDANGKVVVDTNANLTGDSFTAGNVVIHKTTGINAGDMKITNVAPGEIKAGSKDAVNGDQIHNIVNKFNTDLKNVVMYDDAGKGKVTFGGNGGTTLTNVKAGDVSATSKDAINGSQLYTTNVNVAKNAADIAKGYGLKAQDGKTITQALGTPVEVVGGKNINTTVDASGKFVVDTNANLTGDSFTAGNVVIHKDSGINAGGLTINNVKAGAVTATSTEAVNGSQLYAISKNISNAVMYDDAGKGSVTLGGNGGTTIKNVKAGDVSATSKDAINGSQLYATNVQVNANTAAIAKGIKFASDSGEHTAALGSTVGVKGDGKNIRTTHNGADIGVSLNPDLDINSVKLGDVYLGANNISMGGNRITHVGDGVNGHDAVNVNQLNNKFNVLKKDIVDVDNWASGGIAAAMAGASLGQVTEAGASSVSVGVSTYRGKLGWAVGGSNITDNGKWIVKYNVSGSTNAKSFGGAGSVTYQWH